MATRTIDDLSQSAIVFAPHPDDETLGCGGTIICKKAAGASVKIVFITGGSRSHAALIDRSVLREMREKEALQATKTLGIAQEDVIFLGFEDGKVGEFEAAVSDRIQQLIAAHSPQEIFVPYALEPPPDHALTYRAAMSAVAKINNPPASLPTVYAYPIWYWQHWPWMYLAGRRKRETLGILKASLTSYLGTAIFKDFQHAVYIGDVLVQKRKALNQHASQMQRLGENPNWPILEDVSQGDFLDCFFQDYEIFYSPT